MVDSLVAGREDEPFGISVVTVGELDYTVITSNRRDFEKIEGLRFEVRG